VLSSLDPELLDTAHACCHFYPLSQRGTPQIRLFEYLSGQVAINDHGRLGPAATDPLDEIVLTEGEG